MQIFDGLKEIGAIRSPYALVAMMLATSVGLYALSKFVFGRQAYAMYSRRRGRRARRCAGGGALARAAFGLVTGWRAAAYRGRLDRCRGAGRWYQRDAAVFTLANYREALGRADIPGDREQHQVRIGGDGLDCCWGF